MQQMASFARSDILPSWFANALGRFLSTLAPQLNLVQTDGTHVKVAASANDGAAIVSIAGLWRYVEADVGPVAHPGGAAGSYPIFLTCKNNNIVSTPAPFTDATDYSFGLQIKAVGATPTIVAGTVDQYRQVGVAVWDGSAIVRVEQTVPPPEDHQTPGTPPIGACIPYGGSGDPPEGEWVIADGRLIDRTTYEPYFARVGHAYNGGVDPLSNKVRIQDKRGKGSVGAINMGTGAGASDNAHHQGVRGLSYGEVLHQLVVANTPSHAHPGSAAGSHSHAFPFNVAGLSVGWSTAVYVEGSGKQGVYTAGGAMNNFAGTSSGTPGLTVASQGGDGSHNNIHPAEADSWIVRIA